MRHGKSNKKFNRDTKHRQALLKNLVSSLFEHGTIETTEQKAKALKRLADKLIHKAQPGTLNVRRVLERFFGSKQTVNNLVDRVAPSMKDRTSGFTRITRLGRRRGDDAEMVVIELVEKGAVAETPVVEEKKAAPKAAKKTKKSVADKRALEGVSAKAAGDMTARSQAKASVKQAPAKTPVAKSGNK